MTTLSDLNINVVEAGDADEAQPPEEKDDPEADDSGRDASDVDLGRTDDPVRMYLREMGTIELLSREGEIAIAKRIEAGRETMIGAICESPLTMRAIIGWRDALRADRVLLRDIIDLEATYAAGAEGGTHGRDDPQGAAPGAEEADEEADEDLDEIAALLLLVGLLLLAVLGLGIVLLDDVDAHLGELAENVLDLLRGELLRRQNLVQFVISDIAALLRELDHPLDGGIGQIEKRTVALLFRSGRLGFVPFGGLRCHSSIVSPQPDGRG
jgi:hypothetical protein